MSSEPFIGGSRVHGWLKEASVHSLIYGAGAALQALLNFALVPLYTRQLTTEEFGIFRLLVLAASVAGSVFYLGAYSSLSRFYFDSERPEDRREVAGAAAITTVFGGTLQMIAIVLVARPLSGFLLGSAEYAFEFMLAFGASALTFINQIFLLMLRLQRRSVAVVVVNIASIVITVIAAIALLVAWPLGLIGALVAVLAGQALVLPVALWLARDALAWRLSRAQAVQQLAFGLPSVVIGLATTTLDSAGRFVFARMGDLEGLAILTFAYQIGAVVQMFFVQSFTQVWNPMRLEYRNHRDAAHLQALIGTYYTLAGFAFVAGCSLFAPEIVALLGRRPEYASAAAILPLIMTAYLVYGAINLVDTGILVTKRLRYHIILLWIATVLSLGLNVLWIPTFGYVATAWLALVIYAVLLAAVSVLSHKLEPIHVEPRRVVLTICTAIGVMSMAAWLPLAGALGAAGRAGMLAALFASWYAWILSEDERLWIRRQLHGLRHKLG